MVTKKIMAAVCAALCALSAARAGAAGLCTTTGSTNPCVPGGKRASGDCYMEFAPQPVPPRLSNQMPQQTLICYEGDPRCDADPVLNNATCTLQTRLCINNHDPRLRCTPADIAAFEVRSPLPRSIDLYNQINLQTLEQQGGAGGFGVSVYRGKTLVSNGTPNGGSDMCSDLLPIQVPQLLGNRGTYHTGKRTLRLKVTTSGGAVDTDTLNLQCRVTTCGDGAIQSDHEECDQGGGNRANGDGCDAGCHVEPGWACTGNPSVCTPFTPTPTTTSSPTPTPSPTLAPDTVRPLLFFKESLAVGANGDFPPADPKTICGADDRRFLAELVNGSPFNYKVPKRLADIKAPPSEIMVSGLAVDASLGGGDFPFDHTFGSDFNMDVTPDPPFVHAAQGDAMEIGGLHVEISEGQLPHALAAPGPATGQTWADMSTRARDGIDMRFVPEAGDRVLVMGHWIIDCGHTNFDTELHPITFMANGRAVGAKTVVNAFYNPYRETQLYHMDPAEALAFDDVLRLINSSYSGPFPQMLISDVLRLQNLGPAPYSSLNRLESWAMLEANHTSPVEWRVCAPADSIGSGLDVKYHWITRPGVQVEVVPDTAAGCARITTALGSASIVPPTPRVCVLPWDFLNAEAAAEAGVPGLDLQAAISPYISDPYKARLDPDPILNCYDPLMGPAPESPPTGQEIDVIDSLLLPFYGTITVERTP